MSYWIWFPGDFEIYQLMKQNFSREERRFDWPAYWHATSWNHNVRFSRDYELVEPATFYVSAKGKGYVAVKRLLTEGTEQVDKFPFETEITCLPGAVTIEVIVCHLEGLPSIFVSGKMIYSDGSWLSSNYIEHSQPVGTSELFTSHEQNPMEFPYTHEVREPDNEEFTEGGLLLDFGYDITAVTLLEFKERFEPMTLCYGESRTEALDVADCYLKQVVETPDDVGLEKVDQRTFATRLRAFRYIFLPGIRKEQKNISIRVDHQYVDFGPGSQFTSSDERLDQIWQIAERTFRACSSIFFLDGIKRDKWVWSGDAYQSYFINQYSFSDKAIVERTILGLRGNDPFKQHLNTIIDYSLYWLISLEVYNQTFGDRDFLERVYPKMESLLAYCLEQTDENGFIYGRKDDWVYIDWAEFDIEGPLCAEQMLLVRAFESVIAIRKILNRPVTDIERKLAILKTNIQTFYWDADKKAFIDSYESGKRNVTKHANIFAILFDYADEKQVDEIKQHVLLNSQIPEIHTPYFKFWELEVMAKLGEYTYVVDQIKAYWGGMLDEGATTFWEYYDPSETDVSKYAMYGDKYGKSLCHAWGASPIYLIGRYLLGIRSTAPGYRQFEVAPQLDLFDQLSCMFPVGEGEVTIELAEGTLEVRTNVDGGTLRLPNQTFALSKEQPLTITL
ncbi:hypothetical protein [Listeria ilorinensis]|uniref:alpha-L-rhamnosidase-related protein n=1 Tax=Listeria ilorinensis TaxID=2867439 RepID=UPI001EF68104|nr:hypothetical protein [Listeria ilorinensis]